MKNKILFILTAALIMAGCTLKEGNLFDKDPDDRIAEQMELYKNILLDAPNGWFLDVNTGLKGGFRHWVAFNEENSVSMLSDMDVNYAWSNSSTKIEQSTWRLKYDMMPMLVFDTYNYLHYLADPQNTTTYGRPGNGGVEGFGLYSDIEFYIRGVKNGTLVLEGRFHRSAATLTQVSGPELEAVMNGGLKTVHGKTTEFINAHEYVVGRIGDKDVEFNLSTRQVSATLMEGNLVTNISTGASPDLSSILDTEKPCSNLSVIKPLAVNGHNIIAFKCVDQVAQPAGGDGEEGVNTSRFNAVLDDYSEIPLRFETTSLLPDPQLGFKKNFTVLDLYAASELPGSTAPKFMDMYNKATARLKTSGRDLRLVQLQFIENSNGIPVLLLIATYYLPDSDKPNTKYNLRWYYKYTENEDGTITFTDRDQHGSSNERSHELSANVPVFLDYFCEVNYTSRPTGTYNDWVKGTIVPKTFRIEWSKNKTPGSSALTGALVPLNAEGEPDYTMKCVGVFMEKP